MSVILHCFQTVFWYTDYTMVLYNTEQSKNSAKLHSSPLIFESENEISKLNFFFWTSWAGFFKFFTADYASCDGFYTEVRSTTIFAWYFPSFLAILVT